MVRSEIRIKDVEFLIFLQSKKSLKIQRGNQNPRKSKKNRQHNGQKKKDKSEHNDLQHINRKTKDRATLTPLKTGSELRCPGRVRSRNMSISMECRIASCLILSKK